jgi:hypothetical protein
MFGLGGVAFINNLDNLTHLINSYFHTDIPGSKELARSMNSPQAEFGLASQWLGVDVASSGQGTNFGIPATGPAEMLGTMALVMTNLAKDAAAAIGLRTLPSNREDWNKVVKKLPSSFQFLPEQAVQSKDMDDFLDRTFRLKRPSTTTVGTSLDLNYKRTQEQTIKKALTGRASLEEAQATTTMRIDRAMEKRLQKQAEDAYEALKDSQMFNSLTPEQKKAAVNLLALEQGKSPKDIVNILINGIEGRTIPLEQRLQLKRLKSLEGLLENKRYQEIKKREPIR